MQKIPEAVVAVCRCTQNKLQYGVEFQRVDAGTWRAQWAFPLSLKEAKFEGFDTTRIEGNIVYDPHFNGCLTCHEKGFTVCGSCKKLSCPSLDGEIFHCPWCGASGRVTYGKIAFQAGGDY